jgi:hypothetical protein
MNTNSIHFLKAGLSYFGLVFGAGFLLALIRVLRHHEFINSAGASLALGLIALVLLLAAEMLLVVVWQQQTLRESIADRDPVSGSVYLVMLVVFAAMPLIQHSRQFK